MQCALRRRAALHLKDFYGQYRGSYTRKNMPDEASSPIGEGAIRTKDCIELAKTLPNFSGNYIIDQDKSTRDMLADLKAGYENIRKIVNCQTKCNS